MLLMLARAEDRPRRSQSADRQRRSAVTGVERRGAGRGIYDGRTHRHSSRRRCRQGYPRRRGRARWVSNSAWSVDGRMLTALEQGVRGGRWYTLMDKVYAVPTLRAAFARVKANRGAAGVDHVTVAMYEERDSTRISRRCRRRCGTARMPVQAIRRHWIPKAPPARAASVGFRRSEPASCEPRCVWSWNRYST